MAELIIKNALLRTLDDTQPLAEAMAVSGGRIVAVGRNGAMEALASPGARTIDAQGRLLLPGFCDGHIHFYNWSLSLQLMPGGDAASREELLAMLSQKASVSEEGQWIMSRGLDESNWPQPRLPSLAELDRAAPENPVLLYRRDMHLALANSRALSLAGIGRETPDPVEGKIGHDADGNPDGFLRERAMALVEGRIPEPSQRRLVSAVEFAQAQLHRLGVTGVHDLRIMGGICGRPSFAAWQELSAGGRLNLRVWACISGDLLEEVISLGLTSGFGDDRLKIGHMKFFSDGSLGARTAWVFDPYLDAACGMEMTPAEELAERIALAQANGLACAVHAIGDRANWAVLGAFEDAAQRASGCNRPQPLAPHRIEHTQMIRGSDIARLGRLDVVASVQPMHIVDDLAVSEQALADGGANSYRFRDFLDAGVTLSFGSDAPVSIPNPLWAIHAAVTRQTAAGFPQGGWRGAQRVSLEEAVYAHIMGPVIASGRQHELGSISPGKFADVVMLDRDIYSLPEAEIREARVEMTIFNGKVVYES